MPYSSAEPPEYSGSEIQTLRQGLEKSGTFQPTLGADRFQKVVIVQSARELASRLPAKESTLFLLMPPSTQTGVLASLSTLSISDNSASGSGELSGELLGESSATFPGSAAENVFDFSELGSSGSASGTEEVVLTLSEDKDVTVALLGVHQNHQRTVLRYSGNNGHFMTAAGNVYLEDFSLEMPGIQRGVFKESQNGALYAHNMDFETFSSHLPLVAGKGNKNFLLVVSGHTSAKPGEPKVFFESQLHSLTPYGSGQEAFFDEAEPDNTSCYAIAGLKGEGTGFYQHRGFYSNCPENRLWALSDQVNRWHLGPVNVCDVKKHYQDAIPIESSISRVLAIEVASTTEQPEPVATEFTNITSTGTTRITLPLTVTSQSTDSTTSSMPTAFSVSPQTDSSLSVTPGNLLIYITLAVGAALIW
ncbi:MAG: hypothetical protein ACR2PT_09045 [Endozoicomonas sp.]